MNPLHAPVLVQVVSKTIAEMTEQTIVVPASMANNIAPVGIVVPALSANNFPPVDKVVPAPPANNFAPVGIVAPAVPATECNKLKSTLSSFASPIADIAVVSPDEIYALARKADDTLLRSVAIPNSWPALSPKIPEPPPPPPKHPQTVRTLPTPPTTPQTVRPPPTPPKTPPHPPPHLPPHLPHALRSAHDIRRSARRSSRRSQLPSQVDKTIRKAAAPAKSSGPSPGYDPHKGHTAALADADDIVYALGATPAKSRSRDDRGPPRRLDPRLRDSDASLSEDTAEEWGA